MCDCYFGSLYNTNYRNKPEDLGKIDIYRQKDDFTELNRKQIANWEFYATDNAGLTKLACYAKVSRKFQFCTQFLVLVEKVFKRIGHKRVIEELRYTPDMKEKFAEWISFRDFCFDMDNLINFMSKDDEMRNLSEVLQMIYEVEP